MRIEYKKEYEPYLESLNEIYQDMDSAYENVAKAYGFECTGCEDNCCKTHFYHHTLLEYLYLIKGFKALSYDQQKKIREKIAKKQNICILNFDGLCILYEFRPMICRLHGIPHFFTRPDGIKIRGKACAEFYAQFYKVCKEKKDNIIFDRTPFYKKMAELEKNIRKHTEINLKIKMTIRQIFTHYENNRY
jgi:hypothetical protein